MIKYFTNYLKETPWQDWVFTTGGFLFITTLIGILDDPNSKISLFSSLTTGFVIFNYAIAQYTLKLKFSSIVSLITAILWILIAIFKH